LVAVKSRLRKLVYVLAALQVLLAAPVVGAVAGAIPGNGMDCADMMPATPDSDPCPCCPEGDSVAACLSNCLAASCVTTGFAPVAVHNNAAEPPAEPSLQLAVRGDPPIKPPPIR
jgi:hypothetical protein